MDPHKQWSLLCLTLAILGSSAHAKVEGFTEPYRMVSLSAPGEPSLVTKIAAREGASVSAGQIVVEFDARVLQAGLRIAQARCELDGREAAARAEYDLRQERFSKLRLLDQQGHASPTELRRAEADLRVAQANYQLALEEKTLAELERDRIQAQIEQRRLRSPFDGVVTKVFREVGESTSLGESEMITIVQLDRLRVTLPVSAEFARTLRQGASLELELPELGRQVTSEVEIISPVLDAKSGTVPITCVIDNRERSIQSGMRCIADVAGAAHTPDESDRLDAESFGF